MSKQPPLASEVCKGEGRGDTGWVRNVGTGVAKLDGHLKFDVIRSPSRSIDSTPLTMRRRRRRSKIMMSKKGNYLMTLRKDGTFVLITANTWTNGGTDVLWGAVVAYVQGTGATVFFSTQPPSPSIYTYKAACGLMTDYLGCTVTAGSEKGVAALCALD